MERKIVKLIGRLRNNPEKAKATALRSAAAGGRRSVRARKY
jgi:hypothetical protein